MDGWTDGRTDVGRTVTNGRMDGCKLAYTHTYVFSCSFVTIQACDNVSVNNTYTYSVRTVCIVDLATMCM